MADIFNEIEEDIRRERMARLWKRFGPLVIAAAVLLVLVVSGWRAWEWYSAQEAEKAGARYQAALDLAEQDKPAMDALREMERSAPAGYALLARFRAASELGGTDAPAGAAAFDAIAADIAVPALLRDFARIRAALLLLDTASPSDISGRVETLAVAGNTWRHSAREILALAAWKANNPAETRRWAQELIADIEAPPGARGRGQLLLDLASGAGAASAAPPAAAPAAP